MINNFLEVMYIIAGIISVTAGFVALMDKTNAKRVGTSLFWILFGTTFILGKVLPSVVVGAMILVMGLLATLKQVTIPSLKMADEAYKKMKSDKIGYILFIPAASIGVIAFLIGQFTKLGGLLGLGIGALSALIIALIFTKENPKTIPNDSSMLLHTMGAAVVLPQLLASLGALFAKAEVGQVIASILGGFINAESRLIGVTVYCLGMAIFTIIMGNGFAAFAVITAGIGIPFVINLGANPAVVGALGLTAGYCGTLLTPMAANFNIVPSSVLEIEDKYKIIKVQAPVALVMLVFHIVAMYFIAF